MGEIHSNPKANNALSPASHHITVIIAFFPEGELMMRRAQSEWCELTEQQRASGVG
jgi:hypothetical protein